MRRMFSIALILLTPFSAWAGPQEDGQAFFEKFLADFTSGNADAIAANFGPEALFWGTNSRELITSRDKIRGYFAAAFKRLPGSKLSPVGKVSAVTIGNNALVISGVWQNDRMIDGRAASSQARNSMTLIKRDGRWQIISFANSSRPKARK